MKEPTTAGRTSKTQACARDAGEQRFRLAARHDRDGAAKKDFYFALQHYRAAAKAGHLQAQLRLGQIYMRGEHLSKPRYRDAWEFFYLAAGQGSAEAQTAIGWMFYVGLGVKENTEEAIGYLRLAADQGYVGAAARLGSVYFDGRHTGKWKVVRGRFKMIKDPFQNYRKAAYWLRKAAEMGHADSMHGLAICMLEGKGVEVQPAEGMRWLRMAAERGVHSAEHHLGMILSDGLHGEKADGKEGLKWLERAAKSNATGTALNAMNRVWKMYFDGNGVKQDYRAARIWLLKLLNIAQDEDALGAMAQIYEEGLGVKPDPKKARYWHRRCLEF